GMGASDQNARRAGHSRSKITMSLDSCFWKFRKRDDSDRQRSASRPRPAAAAATSECFNSHIAVLPFEHAASRGRLALRDRGHEGYMIIETGVYLSVLLVLLGVGYSAMY